MQVEEYKYTPSEDPEIKLQKKLIKEQNLEIVKTLEKSLNGCKIKPFRILLCA